MKVTMTSLVILILMINLSLFGAIATGEEVKLWVSTDHHTESSNAWDDAITHSNTIFDFDLALILGDLVNGDCDDVSVVDQYQWWNNRTANSTHAREDFYQLTGNHESGACDPDRQLSGYCVGDIEEDWNKWIDPFGENTSYSGVENSHRPYPIRNMTSYHDVQLFYVIDIGNIAIIMIGHNMSARYPCGVNGSGCDWTDTDYAYNYLVETVNYYSPDHNIIVATHATLTGSGLHKYASTWLKTSSRFTSFLANNKETHHIVAWFSGHDHYRNEAVRWNYVSAYNTTFIHQGSIDCSACSYGGHAGTGSHTFLWTFTEGSTTATMGNFDHEAGAWSPSGYPNNQSLTLYFAFQIDEEVEQKPEFLSIGGGGDGGSVADPTPIFNWTKVDDTFKYWLQVDNDADFSSPEVNLDNISIYNYPSHYYEDDTKISFTLPDGNQLTSYDVYYCRVKAFKKN